MTNVRNPMHEASICLETIVDTLRQVDPGMVSVGTLRCLQSNIAHVINTLQYSSWATISKENTLALLAQGQAYLAQAIASDEGEGNCCFLTKCVRSLTQANEHWKCFFVTPQYPFYEY
jgi:hypothetical protein